MTAGFARAGYATISGRGLDWDSVPMRLFQKAKKLGTWDPQALDFSRDGADWASFTDQERDFLLRTLSLFQAGEEGVTSDLLPLIMAVADEGRLEEEIYLTSFLWEEAKHVEFFRRWLDEVAVAKEDLAHYMTPSYRHLFLVELPSALSALKTDRSVEAQIRASVTYNMIIEGVLAETGYHGFRQSLEAAHKLPGLLDGIRLTSRDESRHIRYGVFLLDRLINQSPDGWEVMNQRMNELLGPALGVVTEFWEHYDDENGPFGQRMDTYIDYASTQFDKRMKVLERDRGKNIDEIVKAAVADLAEDEVAPATVGAGD
ncbi:MAG TPA: R2-like ligand-binding oxidase [Candidatus Dormibacteraeota bacterium]|nr:R2-like ligand-binding oxidase [Candidatus Dormibacteraeota bacterium]